MTADGSTEVLRIRGDLVIPNARAFYRKLRAAARKRGVSTVVVDLAEAGKLDSAGVATLAVGERLLARGGKTLELRDGGPQHRAALALTPDEVPEPIAQPAPGFFERVGERVLGMTGRVASLGALIADVGRAAAAVATRRARLPSGSWTTQAAIMGADAVYIVGMLGFLLGMTLAFQAAVQLTRFGAGVFVADLIGVAVVREFAPMMTAIILAGRSGAAIAAELGTMRAGSEIDALEAMGVSPVRYLVLPRVGALAVVQPALTLLAMMLGILGGLVVAQVSLAMSPDRFLARVIERVALADFAHGLGKSLVFALIIALTGCFYGLRTPGHASAVGASTTRAVVVCVTLILVVDAVVATASSLLNHGAPT